MVFSGTLGTALERSLLTLVRNNLCLKTSFRILFGGPLVFSFFIDRKKDAIRFVPVLPKTLTQKVQKYQLRESRGDFRHLRRGNPAGEHTMSGSGMDSAKTGGGYQIDNRHGACDRKRTVTEVAARPTHIRYGGRP